MAISKYFKARAKAKGMTPEAFEETPEGEKLYHGGKVPTDHSPAAEAKESIHQKSGFAARFKAGRK